MGLPWIELHTSLPRHRKSVHLGLLLEDERAWTYMAQLWLWCGENCPSGELRGTVAQQLVECAAGWKGKPGQFAEAAIAAGFIDVAADGLTMHGWAERAAAHIAKQERDAERARERRSRVAEKYAGHPTDVAPTSTERRADVARTSRRRPPDVAGNNNPNPNPENKDGFREGAAAPPSDFRLEEQRERKPRKLSRQEQIARRFAEIRDATLKEMAPPGAELIPDNDYAIGQINRDLKKLASANLSPEVLDGVIRAFCMDRHGLDPPAPLWNFAKKWPEFLSRAAKEAEHDNHAA